MGIYIRTRTAHGRKVPDSPFFWMALDGHQDARGNPLRESTGIRHDAPTPDQRNDNRALAKEIYHARMLELARGEVAGVEAITFADYLDWWIANELPKRRGKEREAVVLPRFRKAFGPLQLTAITRHRVKEWITERLATPTVIVQGKHRREVKAAANTINREVDVLKAILQSAVPTYLESSPLYGMPKLETTTPKRRLMTPDEERKLLAVMRPDDRALFLLGTDALVRLQDCLDVKRSDDHGDRIWIANPKSGKGSYKPISKRLRKALDAIPGDDVYIFARRRRAETERDRRGAVRQMLEMYCRLAGVPYGRKVGGITFHWATRRTGLTRMLTRGVDLGTAQKIGDWKNPDVVLSVYHELIDETARAAVETISRKPREGRVKRNGVKRGKRKVSARQPKHRAARKAE